MRVYNARGELVKVLYDDHRERGRYEAVWNGLNGQGDPAGTGI